MVRCKLSYQILTLLIHINAMSYNKFKGHFTTGICQINRTLHLTTNSIPKAWLISCQGLPNTWTLVNSSTNTCQSDTGWFITLQQEGWKLQSLELPYLHFTGGLEDTWKTFPWSGVKIKMASFNLSLFLITSLQHENNFIFHQCQIS